MGELWGTAHRRKKSWVGKMAKITSAKALEHAREPGIYWAGDNLYLDVSSPNARSWIVRYSHRGKRRDHGIGSAKYLSLKEAREKAYDVMKALRISGTDPITKKRTAAVAKAVERATTMSFADCAARYIEAHRAGWRSAEHHRQWVDTLEKANKVFGKLPVAAVDTGLVMQVLEPLWAKTPETANRLRGRIEAVLDWAKACGYREGENPARFKGHLANLLPKLEKAKAAARGGKGEHYAALPYDQMADFMAALRQDTSIAARALEYTVLVAARAGEALNLTWDMVNLEQRLVTIPGARMKSGKEHRVPLSDAAAAVIEAMAEIRRGEFVFEGQRGRMAATTLGSVLKRMGYNDATTHGFRSTFSDWAGDCTRHERETVEVSLAHAVGNKVEQAYRRSDGLEKRRRLMEDWSRYCGGEARVVPLLRA
jgi:integrase